MKKLVLIVVLLQLCLSVLEVNAGGGRGAGGASASQNQPQFGDLIEFPRPNTLVPTYSHYGIYVGGMDVNGKGPNDNIFEMISDPPGCRFTHEAGPFKIVNHYYTETPQTPEQMKASIEDLMRPEDGRCKDYSLTQENCEMVATLVRYNKKMCKQKGTFMGGAAKLTKPRKKRGNCKGNCPSAA